MLGRPVTRGAVFHAQSQKRRTVELTPELRAQTEAAVGQLHELLDSGRVPPAVLKPRCHGCSLRGFCMPEAFTDPQRLTNLEDALFRADLSDPTGDGKSARRARR